MVRKKEGIKEEIKVESILLELQRDILDKEYRVSDLLRKALVIAHKLNILEIENWINKELIGYKIEEVPEYRIVFGIIKAWRPFKGWQSIIFSDIETQNKLSKKHFYHSISEIEELINRGKKDYIHMPYPPDIEKQLREAIGLDTDITLMVPVLSLIRIVDIVRTTLLKWSLKLEEDGIIGEGLSFSALEKEKAKSKSYIVNNFINQSLQII